MNVRFARVVAAEFVGSTLLLAVIVGSGIMGERLAGNDAIALLANSAATGCGLFVLILVFAPVSGAQLNPLVTLLAAIERTIRVRDAPWIIGAQVAGALAGVAVAHIMFELPAWALSTRSRGGLGQLIAEAVATFGLIVAIMGTRRYGVAVMAAAVGAYIASAYWFTASTSFANPAVTMARALTSTFAGVAPAHVAGFVVAQCLGAIAAFFLAQFLALNASDRPGT